MSLIKVVGLGLATAAAAACASGPIPAPLAPAVRCEAGDSSLVRDVLYFGRNRPAGGVVSDAEWQGFLDQVLTPHFPAGLTVVDARGQWRGKSGRVEQERAEIVTIFHSGDESARRAVAGVIEQYKRRFDQEAVLRERALSCTRF